MELFGEVITVKEEEVRAERKIEVVILKTQMGKLGINVPAYSLSCIKIIEKLHHG